MEGPEGTVPGFPDEGPGQPWAPTPGPCHCTMEEERDSGACGRLAIRGRVLTGMMENRMKRQVSSRATSR